MRALVHSVMRTLAIWALLFVDDIYRGATGNVVTLVTLPMNVLIGLPLMLAMTGHESLTAMVINHVIRRGDKMPRWIRAQVLRLNRAVP